MLRIKRRGDFNTMLGELLVEDESLGSLINERIRWFQINHNDTRLNNHALTKRMVGKWAFSITGDIRIVYEWTGKSTVRFLAIGGHGEAYTRK